jgi:hypothetical protein
MTKSTIRKTVAAAAFALVAVVVPSASASGLLGALTTPVATLGGTAVPCQARVLSTPFAAFGDSHSYFAVGGGSFEGGATGWTLTGGASVVAGGDSFVAGSAGSSLVLPAGSTATTPVTCIDLAAPTLRAFASGQGRVNVSAVVGAAAFPIGSISPSGSWAPTAAFINLSNLLSILSTSGTVTTQFRFSAASGAVKVDDVFVDPYRRT